MGARGHQVHVFAASFEGEAPKGVTFHLVPAPAWPWVLRLTAFASHSAKAIAAAGLFDVVHAHTVYNGSGHIAHAHSVHRRAIAFDRPPGLWAGLRWWLKGLPPWVLHLSDGSYRQAGHCVAISGRIAQELEACYRIPPERVSLIYNAVEAGHFQAAAPTARKALRRRLGMVGGTWAVFCGWNWRRKGLDVLLQALVRVEGVHLAVVGEDPVEGQAFRALSLVLGLGSRVRFVGRQADPLPWFQAADIFAFPTRYEPFGMVVSEAMACGLPVLVPSEAGASEVITAGRDLQVLPSAEDVEALAKGLRTLRDEPAYGRSLGRLNRKAASAMTWARHSAKLEQVYFRLAGSRP